MASAAHTDPVRMAVGNVNLDAEHAAAAAAAKHPDSSVAEAEAGPVLPAGKRNAVVRRRPGDTPFAVEAVVVHDILPEPEGAAVLHCRMHCVVGGIEVVVVVVDDGIQAEEGWIGVLADAENRIWIAPATWTGMHCEVGTESVSAIGNHAGVICVAVNEFVIVSANSSRWHCRCIVAA